MSLVENALLRTFVSTSDERRSNAVSRSSRTPLTHRLQWPAPHLVHQGYFALERRPPVRRIVPAQRCRFVMIHTPGLGVAQSKIHASDRLGIKPHQRLLLLYEKHGYAT
jgi:hypothetical protein